MTARATASVLGGVAMAAGVLLCGPLPAAAQPAGVTLAMGKVRTDAAGAFVTVTANNATAESLPEVQVQCTFYAGNRVLGTAATKIFSVFAASSGSDQVRLLGASGANRAVCRIPQQK